MLSINKGVSMLNFICIMTIMVITSVSLPEPQAVSSLNFNSYVSNPNQESEAAVYGIVGTDLFWASNTLGTGQGHIYKTDISSKVTTTLLSGEYKASWQGLVIGSTIWAVGEMNDMDGHSRAAVFKIGSSGVTVIQMPDTDDCNELIALETDGVNLIAGERVVGGFSHSAWPNGSGVWKIPLATIENTTTWSRTWEDPNLYGWENIVYQNGDYYALLRQPETGKWRIIKSSDLVNWTTDIDRTSLGPWSSFQSKMAKAGSKIAVIAPDALSSQWHLYVESFGRWSDYNLGLYFNYGLGMVYWDSARSKVVFDITLGLYEVNIDGTGLKKLADNPYPNVKNIYQHVAYLQSGFYENANYNGTVYMPVSYTKTKDSALYSLDFSAK
jgi:hypothetical protein